VQPVDHVVGLCSLSNLKFSLPTFFQMNLSVVGGSCFLDASVNDSRVVEVLQPTSGLKCSQFTLIPKGVGTAIVTVYDIGLSLPLSASSLVSFSLN